MIWSLMIYTLKGLGTGEYLEFLLGDEMILRYFIVNLLDFGFEVVGFALRG